MKTFYHGPPWRALNCLRTTEASRPSNWWRLFSKCLPSSPTRHGFKEKHDGARAFDERGAATYMQQILGAMSHSDKSRCPPVLSMEEMDGNGRS